MLQFLSKFFLKKQISLFAPIPLSECTIHKPYLLERAGISSGTAIMIAIPYFTEDCLRGDRNISCYAVSKDYHGFFEALYGELLPALQSEFPKNRFAGFADHSPVAEVEAAARAGLGIIGKNHLLITESHSSFVFLGTLVTDATIPCTIHPVKSCENCGKCIFDCPAENMNGCLSALTQKKGALSTDEQDKILKYRSVWGCDICQMVCPHTVKAIENATIFTPISFFSEQTIPHLTLELLDGMSDEVFSSRAYAWRGKDTIRRNLLLFQSKSTEGE